MSTSRRLAIYGAAFLLIGTMMATSAPGEVPESAVSSERISEVVHRLASDDYRGRAGADSVRAGRWVAEQMRSLDVEPLFSDASGEATFEQEIPNGDGTVKGINIGGVVRGSDPSVREQYVIVSGHHDHLGVINRKIHYGANDNASAVAMVLEAARYFTENRPQRSVILLSFDLEENMLWGSRYFVASSPIELADIALFITADMLGRPLGDLPFDEVFLMGAESGRELQGLVEAESAATGQKILRLGADIVGTRSDYGPFRDRQVPFLFFSTGENPDYHTPRDIPEKLDYARAACITRLIISVAAVAANRDKKIVWREGPPSDLSDATTMNRVCEVVISARDAGKLPLGVVESLLVDQTQKRTKQILAAGKLTASDRTWLIRSAQAMLITLF